MKPFTDRCSAGVLLLAASVLAPGASSGQTTSAFDELPALVRAEDRIVVTGMDGHSVKGRLVSLSDTALRVAMRDTIREFRAAEVERIDRVSPDGLMNGALWGLVAGLGVSFLGGPLLSDQLQLDDADTAAVVALFVLPGLGAAAGAAIDASITTTVAVYTQRRIALMLSMGAANRARATGVGVTLAF
jgi:hypothetical protein